MFLLRCDLSMVLDLVDSLNEVCTWVGSDEVNIFLLFDFKCIYCFCTFHSSWLYLCVRVLCSNSFIIEWRWKNSLKIEKEKKATSNTFYITIFYFSLLFKLQNQHKIYIFFYIFIPFFIFFIYQFFLFLFFTWIHVSYRI